MFVVKKVIPYCLVLTTFPAIGVKEPDPQGQSAQPANCPHLNWGNPRSLIHVPCSLATNIMV
jgi:hypothetical protein